MKFSAQQSIETRRATAEKKVLQSQQATKWQQHHVTPSE
jgi:hypothetical protein